jgi:hypothetical protein
MTKKKITALPAGVNRDFSISLEPVSGNLTLMYVFINGVKVIQADGTKKRTWSGKIPDAQVTIKVRVVGIDNASFKLSIDLPGTADDQSLTLKLQGGYYETEITL